MAPTSRWDRLLQRLHIQPAKYLDISLKASSLRTVQRIAAIRMSMVNSEDQSWEMIFQNTEIMAQIVALAIHNKPTPVPEDLVATIMDHISNEELKVIMFEVYRRLDISSFFVSMGYLADVMMLIDSQETEVSQPL